MIKINLLPYRNERKQEILLQQLVLAIVPLILTTVIVAFSWWSIKSEIATTQSEITKIENEIKKQEGTIKKIEEYKKNKNTITRKMEIINTLQEGKSGPVHLLDDLAISLPGNLWLTSIKQKGMILEITGKSMDNISISNYMTNLAKSSYFNNVDLKQIKSETKSGPKGVLLKNFVITCNIIYKLNKTMVVKINPDANNYSGKN
jgi:type IV pilus assembly protein PilN